MYENLDFFDPEGPPGAHEPEIEHIEIFENIFFSNYSDLPLERDDNAVWAGVIIPNITPAQILSGRDNGLSRPLNFWAGVLRGSSTQHQEDYVDNKKSNVDTNDVFWTTLYQLGLVVHI